MDKNSAAFLAAIACLMPALTPAAAADLGRLFLTPQQRSELDRRRANNIQESIVTQVSRVTVEGRVARSNGKDTTWLNGAPQYDSPRARDPARVLIQQGEQEGSISVKVGETLDRVSGDVSNGLGGGTIAVGPRKRQRP